MERFYQTMLAYIRSIPTLEKIIIMIAKFFPYIMFITYPLLIIYCFLEKNELLLVTIIKPLSAFLLVTIIRKIINRPRPYETMKIIPLRGHIQGESFPSRLSVSAVAIALAGAAIDPMLGVFLIIIALIICLSRILCGVHYPSDVITAIIIALLINYI